MNNVKTKKEEKVTPEENVWTDECEALLAEWSEKASCYRWLHGRCEKSYRKWYYCFSIPVIILSTLTGAANVGMDSFVPAESKSIASAAVGGVNIFAGIISTLQNFLKVAELMEAHRIAGVSWGKLQRNIAIELALDPSRRVIQSDFLKLSRAEYDRLIEAGPIIDDGVIKQFNAKFANYEVSVPSICNGLDKCTIYKLDKTIKMNKKDFTDGIEDLIVNEEEISEDDQKLNIIKIDKINNSSNSEDITIVPSLKNNEEDGVKEEVKEVKEGGEEEVKEEVKEGGEEEVKEVKEGGEEVKEVKEGGEEEVTCTCKDKSEKESNKVVEEEEAVEEIIEKVENEENKPIDDFLSGIEENNDK
tara:strand:- start:909 stop:1988 length:1080 start_codon:yes stop_codon:yes gene_type:complete